jgi:hypothetical protein
MRSILIYASILSLISCRQSGSMTEDEKAAIVADVRRTLDNYYNDIRKSGLTAEFKYLDNSAEFFWVPPGYPNAISYDSVAAVLNQNAGKFTHIDNTFDTLQIFAISRRYATYTGRLTSVMTDTSGQTRSFNLVETGVMTKKGDAWKLLSGQTSIVDPQ